MAARHLDKLTRAFLQTSSLQDTKIFNAFTDIQDPTYVSFRLNFFPDAGYGVVRDSYSSNGLFRPAKMDAEKYWLSYLDSAYEYLRRIGSPSRQIALSRFTELLKQLQNDAPWYFQSISGVADLYKIDPAINFRAKDKVLTIECLESVDMRMSFLADLYRMIAFDPTYMKEILPINLRTFKMRIDVLEFRNFNTTFGPLADKIGGRTTTGQSNQTGEDGKARKNVFGSNLGAGVFNNLNNLVLNTGIGNFLSSANEDIKSYESAFDAISVHSFVLNDCEFDFFSEAPSYFDTISVKEQPEATSKFKIKVGLIEKVSTYPFYKYILSEYLPNSFMDIKGATVSTAFTENITSIETMDINGIADDKGRIAEFDTNSISPSSDTDPKKAIYNALKSQEDASKELRKRPMERLIGGLLKNTTNYINEQVNNTLGNLTGGVIGEEPLGNVYGKPSLLSRLRNGLSSFFTPGSEEQIKLGTSTNSSDVFGNILNNVSVITSLDSYGTLPSVPSSQPLPINNVYVVPNILTGNFNTYDILQGGTANHDLTTYDIIQTPAPVADLVSYDIVITPTPNANLTTYDIVQAPASAPDLTTYDILQTPAPAADLTSYDIIATPTSNADLTSYDIINGVPNSTDLKPYDIIANSNIASDLKSYPLF